ncbi:hypothetical protein [Rhizobium cremeum]|uniref:hypothetical protein n=1 Tax=Rhizobium cremeum TaxID=2813827 RepID=UPI0039E094C7
MNVQSNITSSPVAPTGDWHPVDDINRAGSIVFTCWLAMMAKEFDAEADGPTVADTLYDAFERIRRAEKKLDGPSFAVVKSKAPAETSDDLARIGKMIANHRETYLTWNDLCHLADVCDHRHDPKMVPLVKALDDREAELLQALIDEPVWTFEALQAKGAHLAAIHARGGLSYEEAFAFVASFHNPNVRVER